jgi:hypothetical protein
MRRKNLIGEIPENSRVSVLRHLKHANDVGHDDRPRDGDISIASGEIFTPGNAGIVDKYVKLRELLPDARSEGIDGVLLLDVELHAVRSGIGRGDLVEHILTATGDNQLVAAFMEGLGEGAANAAGTASDEGRVASWKHSFSPASYLRHCEG